MLLEVIGGDVIAGLDRRLCAHLREQAGKHGHGHNVARSCVSIVEIKWARLCHQRWIGGKLACKVRIDPRATIVAGSMAVSEKVGRPVEKEDSIRICDDRALDPP